MAEFYVKPGELRGGEKVACVLVARGWRLIVGFFCREPAARLERPPAVLLRAAAASGSFQRLDPAGSLPEKSGGGNRRKGARSGAAPPRCL